VERIKVRLILAQFIYKAKFSSSSRILFHMH